MATLENKLRYLCYDIELVNCFMETKITVCSKSGSSKREVLARVRTNRVWSRGCITA